jgi:hypothetical protein
VSARSKTRAERVSVGRVARTMNRPLIIPARKTLPWALLFTYTLSLLLPMERREEKVYSGWEVVHGLLINVLELYRIGGPLFRDLVVGVVANAFFLFGCSCLVVAAGRRRLLYFAASCSGCLAVACSMPWTYRLWNIMLPGYFVWYGALSALAVIPLIAAAVRD